MICKKKGLKKKNVVANQMIKLILIIHDPFKRLNEAFL